MLGLMRLTPNRSRLLGGLLGLLSLGMPLAGCQSQGDQEAAATPPPVGHYEGSIAVAGQPELRAALDIRHPSPGHYEAELTVPAAGTLSFVADTILFSKNQLRLTRPARPNQVLTLTQDGEAIDQGRGANVLDGPLHALLHFVQALRSCPGAPALLPGDVVTTGTWTDAWPVSVGQAWIARFDAPLSPLEVRFAA